MIAVVDDDDDDDDDLERDEGKHASTTRSRNRVMAKTETCNSLLLSWTLLSCDVEDDEPEEELIFAEEQTRRGATEEG